MRRLLLLIPAVALAQGTNVTLSWTPPSAFTDNTPISAAITYNLYAATDCTACPCANPSFAQIATGITGTSSVRTNVAYAVIDYRLTAVVAGEESSPVEYCWAYKAPPKIPAAPSGFIASQS